MKHLKNRIHFIFAATSFLILNCAGTARANERSRELPPPENVKIAAFPFGQTLTPTSAVIRWDRVPSANNYLVVIFKMHEKEIILHEEVKNVPGTSVEFTDLDSSTTYEVVVNSVIVHLDGTREQSKDATRLQFTTRNACTGSTIFVPCSAHCVPTCKNRRPACDRRCISGCSCPLDIPYMENGRCISKEECKKAGAPPTEVVKRPTGLKIHRIKGTRNLLFTWNKVTGADHYRVIVTLSDGTEIQRHKVEVEVMIIKDLKPRTRYKFKVQAIFVKFSEGSSRTLILGMPPMIPPEISQVTNTSFFAKWQGYPGATGFKMVIYDGTTGEILQIFDNLAEFYVTVQGLSPATVYGVTIIVTLPGTEVESGEQTVKTLGEEGQSVFFGDGPDEIIHIIEETTTTTVAPPSTAPYVPTCRQVEQSFQVFQHGDEDIPKCDKDGNYAPTQCLTSTSSCHCVERRSGDKIEGTDFKSKTSSFALACDKYGQFNIPPLQVRTSIIDTTTIRVRWDRLPTARFYIVKIFNGYEGLFIKSVTVDLRPTITVGGLDRGTPYVVIVVAVNSDGWTSTDNVQGSFIATPHLDPPTNLRLEQFSKNQMKFSWQKDEIALNYDVEVSQRGNGKPTKFENVTKDHIIFPVHGVDPYVAKIRSKGVTTVPGTRTTVVTSSNTVSLTRPPTCLFPPLNVVFVIDVSTAASEEEYEKMKLLYYNLIMGLTPVAASTNDVTGTRFAAVKTYGVSRTMFDFDNERFDNAGNIWAAVKFVGRTEAANFNVERMVDHVYSEFLAPGQRTGARRNVHTAVISFIGGIGITRSPDFEQKTRRLQSATNFITIAVDGAPQQNVQNRNKVEIPSYDDTQIAYDLVMRILCNLK